ncbi:MAG: dipeptidase E [Bacteriovoracaceae bacterium]|jgi:dipeptidase E
MALFLTGGGDQSCFAKLDKLFIESLPQNAKILLIPFASEDYDEVYERIEHHFSHKKIASINMIQKQEDITAEVFDEHDAIMIEGGNTFDLITSTRSNSFFSLIKNFHKEGKHIYADSAGAIILGNDIQTAFLGEDADEDQQKLQDLRGLDLIHPWTIHAHATPDEFEDLNDLLYDKGNPILALSEETGIFINGDELVVFGQEPLEVITFAGRKSLVPGEVTNHHLLQE